MPLAYQETKRILLRLSGESISLTHSRQSIIYYNIILVSVTFFVGHRDIDEQRSWPLSQPCCVIFKDSIDPMTFWAANFPIAFL